MEAASTVTGHHLRRPEAAAQAVARVAMSQMTPSHGFHTGSVTTAGQVANSQRKAAATTAAPRSRATDHAASTASATAATAARVAPHSAPWAGSRRTGTARVQNSRGPKP